MDTKVIIAGVIGLIVGAGGVFTYTKDAKGVQDVASNTNLTGHQMEQSNDAMMRELEGKQGDAFDQAFIQQMTIHHRGAIQMAEIALQNAAHAEIKEMAREIITAQNAEIQQMREWQMNWYGAQAPVTSGDASEPGSSVHNVQ